MQVRTSWHPTARCSKPAAMMSKICSGDETSAAAATLSENCKPRRQLGSYTAFQSAKFMRGNVQAWRGSVRSHV